MTTYFITGATGTIGHNVVNSLLTDGHAVIAASRHPEQARELFGGRAEVVSFDFADSETFDQAVKAAGIFLLGPPLVPDLFALLEPFVDRLIATDYAGRLVYLSAYGMDDLKELPFHAQMEAKLSNSSLSYHVVRPGFFAQNFGNYERENIEQRGIVFASAGDGCTPFVSALDVGRCVAVLLTDQDRYRETHELTGPQAYSYFGVAELLTEILGKQITYPNPDEATYRAALSAAGAPDFIADYMLPVSGLIKAGKVAGITDNVYQLTGRQPETLISVLRRDFGA